MVSLLYRAALRSAGTRLALAVAGLRGCSNRTRRCRLPGTIR